MTDQRIALLARLEHASIRPRTICSTDPVQDSADNGTPVG